MILRRKDDSEAGISPLACRIVARPTHRGAARSATDPKRTARPKECSCHTAGDAAQPRRTAKRYARLYSILAARDSLKMVAAHLTNLRPTAIAFVQCNNSGLGHCAVHHSTL